MRKIYIPLLVSFLFFIFSCTENINIYENGEIKETLNWKPETEFRRGISDTIDFYLKKFQAEFLKDSSNIYLKDII